MSRIIKKRSKKAGLPPGSLVHIGDKKTDKIKIKIFDYDANSFQEKETKDIRECFSFKDKSTITWIDIDGIHDVSVLKKFGECFGLHPLVLEDIMNTDQRPKIEDFGNYAYIVVKMLYHNSTTGDEIKSDQVSFILGTNFVISLQESEGDVFDSVRARIRESKGQVRKKGADYLIYILLDTIIDNYFSVLEKLSNKIEGLEDELVNNPSSKTLQTIYDLRQEMIFLRKSVWPLREVINRLMRGDMVLVDETTRVYLRDVHDHVIQVIDTIEIFRDMLSSMLEIYLSSISYKMNEVMKILTIITTIFIPLTFISSVYGMNFKHMPELDLWWSYPTVIVSMIFIAIMMIFYFKRKKWM